MKRTSKGQQGRLRIEFLEDRVQPTSLLFGDIFTADGLWAENTPGSSVRDDLALLAESQTTDFVLPVAGPEQQLVRVTPSPTQTVMAAGPGAAALPSAQSAGALSMAAAVQTQTAVQLAQTTGLTIAGQAGVQSVSRAAALLRQAEVTPLEAVAQQAVLSQSNLSVRPVDYVTSTVTTCGAGAEAVTFSTFKGGSELDAMHGVATAAGVTYAAGVTTAVDGSGVTGMLITAATTAGACTDIVLATLDGTSIQANAIAVTSDGASIYLGGQNTTTNQALLLQMLPDGTIVAGVELTGSGAVPLSVSGVSRDPISGSVLITGRGEDDMAQGNILIGVFDAALTLPPMFLAGLGFVGSTGSEGYSIAADDSGHLYLGGRNNDGTTTSGVFFRINSDFATVEYVFAWQNPGAGIGTVTAGVRGVAIVGNFFYMTGTLANNNPAPQDGTNLILAKVNKDTGSLTGGWAFNWSVAMSTGDFGGYGLAVDSAGSPYVSASINGPVDPILDIDGILVKFGTGGNTIVGIQTYANPESEEKTDRLLGVALGGTAATSDVAVAGLTNSPDLEPIMAACQAEYAGAQDGLISRNTQPLPAP